MKCLLQICLALVVAGWSTSSSQTNILAAYNGDFELGLTQWRFFEVPTALGSTASVVSTDIAQGTKAIKLTFVTPDSSLVDRALDNWNTNVPVVGGQNYKVSVQAKTSSTGTLKLSIVFGFFDASRAIISQVSNGFLLSSSYQTFSIASIAPATSAYCWIAFRLKDENGKNATGTFFLDDAQLLPTPLVFVQEFQTWWRTPRYVSGRLAIGVASSSPWSHWDVTEYTGVDPEEIISGNWRRNTISKGYPLIGTYDSRNTEIPRWYFRLGKISGLSGILVDLNCDQTGYFESEPLDIFGQLLDISQEEGLRIAITDDAAFGNDQAKNLAIMIESRRLCRNSRTIRPISELTINLFINLIFMETWEENGVTQTSIRYSRASNVLWEEFIG